MRTSASDCRTIAIYESTPQRRILTAARAAAILRAVSPIAFTDEQLDAMIAAAAPLAPIDRGPFLEAVAAALQDREVGDGAVYLAITAAQRQFRGIPPIADHVAKKELKGERPLT